MSHLPVTFSVLFFLPVCPHLPLGFLNLVWINWTRLWAMKRTNQPCQRICPTFNFLPVVTGIIYFKATTVMFVFQKKKKEKKKKIQTTLPCQNEISELSVMTKHKQMWRCKRRDIRIHPLGTNVCTQFHVNLSNIFWDFILDQSGGSIYQPTDQTLLISEKLSNIWY